MKKLAAPAIFVLGFILLFAQNTHADAPEIPFIGGEYFIIGTGSCAYVNGYYDDFGPNWVLPFSGGSTRSRHYQGHLNLNRDGTGTLTSFVTQYTHQRVSSGAIPVQAFRGTCNVTYEQLPGGRLVLHQLSGCPSEIIEGAGMGGIWFTGEDDLTFDTSMDGGILLLSKTRLVPETTWQYDEYGNETNLLNRVCSRTFMAVRQSPGR